MLDAGFLVLDGRWLRSEGQVVDGAFELEAGREIIYVFKKRRRILGQCADIYNSTILLCPCCVRRPMRQAQIKIMASRLGRPRYVEAVGDDGGETEWMSQPVQGE